MVFDLQQWHGVQTCKTKDATPAEIPSCSYEQLKGEGNGGDHLLQY
jgi:hypothetical protein